MLAKHRINFPSQILATTPAAADSTYIIVVCRLSSTTFGHLRRTKKKRVATRDTRSGNFPGIKINKLKKNRDSEFSNAPKPISGNFSTKPSLKNRF
jgi:hypothetical protein